VEACPTDAITHGHGFELASFNASNLIYRKEQLLAITPAPLGANAVFNGADTKAERRRKCYQGAKKTSDFKINPTPVPRGPAFVHKPVLSSRFSVLSESRRVRT